MTQPDGDQGGSANSGQGDAGGGGITAQLYTKQHLDHTAAQARRGALGDFFGKLGLEKPPTEEEAKAILDAAEAHRKAQDGQKGDVERLTGELATKTEEANQVPTLKAQLLRTQLAGDAGLKSRYHRYVEGDDEESIKASIKEVLADIRGGGDGAGDDGDDDDGGGVDQQQSGTHQRRQGTGSLTPNPQQGAGAGGGKATKSSMQAGRDAYKAKREEKE